MISIYKDDLFQSLTEDQMELLVAKSSLKNVPRGEIIQKGGLVSTDMIYVVSGWVKVYKKLDTFQDLVGRVVMPKKFVSFKGIYDKDTYNQSLGALTSVELLFIPTDLVKTLMKENPVFQKGVNKLLTTHLNMSESWSFITHPMRSRDDKIISLLLYLVDYAGHKVGKESVIKIETTQSELAEIIGTTRQSLSEVMNELRRKELIHYSREQIIVRDKEELKKQLEHDYL